MLLHLHRKIRFNRGGEGGVGGNLKDGFQLVKSAGERLRLLKTLPMQIVDAQKTIRAKSDSVPFVHGRCQ